MPQTDPRLERVHRFFSGTGRTYDAMVHYATLGIDHRWKRRIVTLMPPDATRVLDLACGTGISTLAIAQAYPRCQVVGVELREEYLAIARRKVGELGIQNVRFALGRAEDYRSEDPFDCIASSYLAKYADLAQLTTHSKAMLKDGGVVLMHDFTFPPKPALVRIWRLYFWLLQRVGSRLYPAWREIYYGLPRLIEETSWIQELTDILTEHQFERISLEYLTLYGSAIITATKPTIGNATATIPRPAASPLR
jgi:demethylmenaquinone methyltransferase / 2-methoxy-6-polyprenyl-1,4-benzoquinol methylase